MNCKPTYKGVRYNSLEELYKANGANPQQKQQAQHSARNTPNTTLIDEVGRKEIEDAKNKCK